VTADEIKALVETLRGSYGERSFPCLLEAASQLESLQSQLTAKTELATLYAATLRRSEDEADRLRHLLSEVAALKRYDPDANRGWNSSHVVLNPTKDLLERIDADRSQSEEKP